MHPIGWLAGELGRFLSDQAFVADVLRNGGLIAAIGFIGSLSVALGSWVARHISAWLSRRITRYAIDVGPWPLGDIGSNKDVKLRCLLVRYGADIYLERMASDRDKHEGRLRNRVLPNRVSIIPAPSWRIWERLIHWWKCRVLFYTPVQPDSNNIEGNFLLPVHQRLGTQFKLFFQIKACAPVEAWARTAAAAGADASAAPAGPGQGQGPRLVNWRPRDPQAVAARQVAEALALRYGLSADEITEVPEYRSWLRFRPPAYRCHLWFCLDSFPKVKTVDGITNNMCYPL